MSASFVAIDRLEVDSDPGVQLGCAHRRARPDRLSFEPSSAQDADPTILLMRAESLLGPIAPIAATCPERAQVHA